jgi:hypothetical protein
MLPYIIAESELGETYVASTSQLRPPVRHDFITGCGQLKTGADADAKSRCYKVL